MRHKKKIKKLGKAKSHRKAMIANLASSLIRNEYIVTTTPKAKACKAFVDKVVSIGKAGDVYSRQRVSSLLRDRLAAAKVMDVLSEKYKDRVGGYVTSVRVGSRSGDNASLTKLVLVGSKPYRKVKKVSVRKKRKKKKEKEAEISDDKKQTVMDKVKGLRGRFKKTKDLNADRDDRAAKDVKAKSRSGI